MWIGVLFAETGDFFCAYPAEEGDFEDVMEQMARQMKELCPRASGQEQRGREGSDSKRGLFNLLGKDGGKAGKAGEGW